MLRTSTKWSSTLKQFAQTFFTEHLRTTVPSGPNVYEEAHKKLVVIDFYNSKRCRVDTVNQMIRDYSWQSI